MSPPPPPPPRVYYCNISNFQSLVTSHVYMTLGIRQLAIFASKNKQVVQIRIQVSHAEAVLERWSLAQNVGNANVNVYHFGIFNFRYHFR